MKKSILAFAILFSFLSNLAQADQLVGFPEYTVFQEVKSDHNGFPFAAWTGEESETLSRSVREQLAAERLNEICIALEFKGGDFRKSQVTRNDSRVAYYVEGGELKTIAMVEKVGVLQSVGIGMTGGWAALAISYGKVFKKIVCAK